MMKIIGLTTLILLLFVSSSIAGGNFAFVVPAEPGLALEVTGFGQDGSKLFDVQTNTRENSDGVQSYVVRVDENIILASKPAKWCVANRSGQSSTFPPASSICDDHPSEVRGTYTFKPPAAASVAPPDDSATKTGAAVPADFTFAYGSDVGDKVRKQVEASMKEARAYFLKKLGVTVTIPVAVYVSADAAWMTDSYLKQVGLGETFRQGKQSNFAGCHGGEAAYGAIFMCSKSDVFSKDWYGSGLGAQRTYALAHEYFHNLQFQLDGERARHCCTDNDNPLLLLGPQWLVEGSAEYMAFNILGDSKRMNFKKQLAWQLKNAATIKGPLSGLETRAGYYGEPGASWAGLSAVHKLVGKAGFDSLPAFWSAMSTGVTWQEAFLATFGETPEAFYATYEQEIHGRS
jgi:hypothetical protein